MLQILRDLTARLTARLRTPSPVVEPPLPIPKNEIEELIDKWGSIEPSRLNGVFSSDMSILKVHLCRGTVQEYGKHLDFVSDHFRRDVDLKPVMLVFQGTLVYLRDFFINDKGFYLDPVEETIALQLRAIEFLRLYNHARTGVDPSFPQQRNVSLTAHLVSELHQLAEVLQL